MKPLTYRHTRIACYGAYVTQAIINNLAPLLFTIFQRRFGVTLEEVGSLILINFTAQIFVDLAAARFADKIGYRNGMVIAHLFCIAGLAFLVVLPQILPSAFAGLLIAVADDPGMHSSQNEQDSRHYAIGAKAFPGRKRKRP